MLKINAQAYSVEAANPQHEHQWKVWRDVKLPDGKILIPGVVSHASNVVEHPELVADRIVQYAEIIGRENVIAGTDCGMGNRVHPQIGWAKFKALRPKARHWRAKNSGADYRSGDAATSAVGRFCESNDESVVVSGDHSVFVHRHGLFFAGREPGGEDGRRDGVRRSAAHHGRRHRAHRELRLHRRERPVHRRRPAGRAAGPGRCGARRPDGQDRHAGEGRFARPPRLRERRRGTMSKENFTRENLIDHLERYAYLGFSAVVSIADLAEREIMPGDHLDVFQAPRDPQMPKTGRFPWGDVPLRVRKKSFRTPRCFARRARACPGPEPGPAATRPEMT